MTRDRMPHLIDMEWAVSLKMHTRGGRGYEFETLIVSMKGMENAR